MKFVKGLLVCLVATMAVSGPAKAEIMWRCELNVTMSGMSIGIGPLRLGSIEGMGVLTCLVQSAYSHGEDPEERRVRVKISGVGGDFEFSRVTDARMVAIGTGRSIDALMGTFELQDDEGRALREAGYDTSMTFRASRGGSMEGFEVGLMDYPGDDEEDEEFPVRAGVSRVTISGILN